MSNDTEVDFDDEGFVIPGKFPISTVSIGMWGEDGTPLPSVESAVCDLCGSWASALWTSGESVTRGRSLTDQRTSRTKMVIVYACPDHSQEISDGLVNEYGHALNVYKPDELALEVVRRLPGGEGQ